MRLVDNHHEALAGTSQLTGGQIEELLQCGRNDPVAALAPRRIKPECLPEISRGLVLVHDTDDAGVFSHINDRVLELFVHDFSIGGDNDLVI